MTHPISEKPAAPPQTQEKWETRAHPYADNVVYLVWIESEGHVAEYLFQTDTGRNLRDAHNASIDRILATTMFKNPPSVQWVDAHKDDGPEIVGSAAPAPPSATTTNLGEPGAGLAATVPTQNALPLVDQVAIEVAYCRHVGFTVHETARRVIAIIKPSEVLESADSAVRAGLRIEERMRAEMQAMNDRWARLHEQLRTLPDDDWDEAPFAYIERLRAFPDIDTLVNRFLAWPLPESVCSDPCVTQRGYPHRSGTNLLTADEARQMVEYLLAPSVGDGNENRPAAPGNPKPSLSATTHGETETETERKEQCIDCQQFVANWVEAQEQPYGRICLRCETKRGWDLGEKEANPESIEAMRQKLLSGPTLLDALRHAFEEAQSRRDDVEGASAGSAASERHASFPKESASAHVEGVEPGLEGKD